jgi:hypothetical protein
MVHAVLDLRVNDPGRPELVMNSGPSADDGLNRQRDAHEAAYINESMTGR